MSIYKGQLAMRSITTPASRRTDPQTSFEAERYMNASGERRRQQELLLNLVKTHPNCTFQELAQLGVLGRDAISRRMSELVTAKMVEMGRARRCTISGRKAHVWFPIERGALL